jgi:hypothetical protein
MSCELPYSETELDWEFGEELEVVVERFCFEECI